MSRTNTSLPQRVPRLDFRRFYRCAFLHDAAISARQQFQYACLIVATGCARHTQHPCLWPAPYYFAFGARRRAGALIFGIIALIWYRYGGMTTAAARWLVAIAVVGLGTSAAVYAGVDRDHDFSAGVPVQPRRDKA